MTKTKTYTIPLTVRLSPSMMEVVDSRSRARGVTAVDWVRHAIAFTFEEETYLREHLSDVIDERPRDYLADFEELPENPNGVTESPFSNEHKVRVEQWRLKGRIDRNKREAERS